MGLNFKNLDMLLSADNKQQYAHGENSTLQAMIFLFNNVFSGLLFI